MNRRCSAVFALAFLSLPAIARAEDAPKPLPAPSATPATAPTAPATTGVPATPTSTGAAKPADGVAVELAADDGRATIERRVATSSPGGVPFIETGIFSVGHWEHTCVTPCADVKLDPRYTYRVAGDGLVPTDSFALPRDGRVKVDAKMGSSAGRVTGIVATAGGALLIAAGGLALVSTPILESQDVGSKGFRSAVLAGGVGAVSVGLVAAGVGLYLWLANGSHAHTENVGQAPASRSTN